MPTTSWTDFKWPILAVAAATAATATVASYSLYPRRDKKAQTSDTALKNIDTVLIRSKVRLRTNGLAHEAQSIASCLRTSHHGGTLPVTDSRHSNQAKPYGEL